MTTKKFYRTENEGKGWKNTMIRETAFMMADLAPQSSVSTNNFERSEKS